jgi:hypothetical protein
VLKEIEKRLKGPIFLPGIPADVIEMHAVFGYASHDLRYYTEFSLRYRLETEEWWLVQRRLAGGSRSVTMASSQEPSFWRDLREISPKDMASKKLHWGEFV